MTEFEPEAFAKDLGVRLGLEFCSWSVYLKGLVRIRAFALNVNPSAGMLEPCLLTDCEPFDLPDDDKWCLGDWRLYNFTSSPASSWPYGEELCAIIREYAADRPHDHVHPKFDYSAQPREDFDVLLACAAALREPEFLKFLDRFDLTEDFEVAVFHEFDERSECNFADPSNQDLSILTRRQ